jgi:hypothetical protein
MQSHRTHAYQHASLSAEEIRFDSYMSRISIHHSRFTIHWIAPSARKWISSGIHGPYNQRTDEESM